MKLPADIRRVCCERGLSALQVRMVAILFAINGADAALRAAREWPLGRGHAASG